MQNSETKVRSTSVSDLNEEDLSIIEMGGHSKENNVEIHAGTVKENDNISSKRSKRNIFGLFSTESQRILIEEENENYINQTIIQALEENESKPMNRHRRKITEAMNFVDDIFEDVKDIFEGDESDSEESNADSKPPQTYRIDTYCKPRSTSIRDKMKQCFNLNAMGQAEKGLLIPYLHWTFNASFFTLFISTLINFMVLVLVFAGFIVLAATLKPTCVTPNSATHFADAFALSWTTFTTVGYGNIYPSLASQESEVGRCTFITFLTSMEAFVGVLYAGFCGAIVFGKVLKVQSQAQVSFSDIILIQFGGGNLCQSIMSIDAAANVKSRIPCPILEFRLLNRLYPRRNCEIIDATLNCVLEVKSKYRNDIHPYYSKLDLRMSTHPLFSSKWHARHVMDENSPILRPYVRKLIKENGGYWPNELNSYNGVKDSIIDFKKLFVSLSGTSNLSASSVFAQKEYCKFHMFVGYEFVHPEYKTNKNKELLDIDMINDVMEQQGGGGEPFLKKND